MGQLGSWADAGKEGAGPRDWNGPRRGERRKGHADGEGKKERGESGPVGGNHGLEARLAQFFSNLSFLILFQMGFKFI